MTDAPARPAIALTILGAGGHARVVLDVAERAGMPIAGFVDRSTDLHGQRIGGHLVLGDDGVIDGLEPGAVILANGIGVRPDRADPGTRLRARLHDRYVARGHHFPPLVDPTAIIAAEVSLADGVQVMAGAVVQPRCELGADAVVNTRVAIDHDCRIGAHAFVSPGAILCGGVEVGPYAFVGAGAILLPGAVVGEGAIVQAGAVLDGRVADGALFSRRRG